MKRYSRLLYLMFLILIFTACSRDAAVFHPGDMKKDFCGTHLNYQYCECAFNNAFCEEIAMGPDEAKDFVKNEYDKWVLKESMAFADNCKRDNGIMEKGECRYCGEGKIVREGKCERDKSDSKDDEKNDSQQNNGSIGKCWSDDDCPSTCQNNNLLASKCNMQTTECEMMSEKDCTLDLENFGNYSFPMICVIDACKRDETAVIIKREELQNELNALKPKLAEEDAGRLKFSNALSSARKYCQMGEDAVDLESLKVFTALIKTFSSDSEIGEDDFAKLDEIQNKASLDDTDIETIKSVSCNLSTYFQSALDKLPIGDEALRAKVKELEESIDLLSRPIQ